jgi:signal transduction histidine kinase
MAASDTDTTGNLKKSHQSDSPSLESGSLKELHQRHLDWLAHDLKTPLIGSREILQLMLGGVCGKIDPEIERLLVLLRNTNEEFLHMLETFLDIYRYQAGADVLNRTPTDLSEMIKQNLCDLEPSITQRGVRVKFDEPKQQATISLDQTAAKKLLTKLLANCIEHQHSEGQLTISMISKPDHAIMAVSADGLTITKDELDALFLTAGRHTGGRSHSTKAGLELHLCYQIVHAHGGTIEARNTDGGLTLTLRLPK